MKHFLSYVTFGGLILLGAIELGHAAPKAPERTHDFLTYCNSNPQGCEDEIFTDYVTMLFDSPPATCATKADLRDKPGLRNKLLQWITQRKELADRMTVESVRAFFKAVYPCR